MWDNPRLLNLAADALYLAAAVLAAALAWHAALRAPYVPLRTVTLVGDVAHADAGAVHEQLAGRVAGNFFGVNLDEVRRLVGELPWVRAAAARREWPGGVVVAIEAHAPLARWSDRLLVNAHGELFEGRSDARLPQFGGPPGTAAEVAHRYLRLRGIVAPLGVEPVQVMLSARHAWQVKLSNGMTLELGRDQPRQSIEQRLERFVAAYPRAVASLNRRFEHVDLRHPGGFAVRVPELPAAGEPAADARRRG